MTPRWLLCALLHGAAFEALHRAIDRVRETPGVGPMLALWYAQRTVTLAQDEAEAGDARWA